MERFSCVIIEDDEIDRITVTSFAKRCDMLEILGIFESADDALPFVMQNPPQVLLLDIDMDGTNGLELRRHAADVPVCVFISAHPEHAIETFALDTLDFIVKPLKFDRFMQTMKRVQDYMEIREKASLFEATLGGDAIYIKEGHEQIKVKLHEILYLEALKDYTRVVTQNKTYCVLSSLGNLLKEDNFLSFLRVHRSFAVQKQYIDRILPNDLLLHNGLEIPVGRSYKDMVKTIME